MSDRQDRLNAYALELEVLCLHAEGNYLNIGKILWEVKEEALYHEAGCNFKEWLQDFRLPTNSKRPYNWACNCADTYGMFIVKHKKKPSELAIIGRSKLIHMIPLARKVDAFPDDLWEFAKMETTTDRALREKVGHNVGQDDFPRDKLRCPNCGHDEFKCKKCGGTIQFGQPERERASVPA